MHDNTTTTSRSTRSLTRSLALLGAMGALAASSTASATALSEPAEALEPGQWVEIELPGYDHDLLVDYGGHHLLQYAEGAKWDAATGRMMYLGQGHSSNWDDDPSTPSIFLRYDDLSGQWEQLPTIPSENIGHTYDHSAYDAAGNVFYHRSMGSRVVYAFDVDAGSWSALPEIDQGIMPATSCCGALEVVPELDSLVLVDGNWGVVALELGQQQWRRIANTNNDEGNGQPTHPMGEYHNFAEYSPQLGALVFGGGNGSSAMYRLDADESITALGDAPVPALGPSHSIVVTDPNTGVLLVLHNDGTFWEYDGQADGWLQQDATPLPSDPEGAVFGTVAAPIDNYGVVLLLSWNGGSPQAWLYRHSAGQGEPPEPPEPPSGDDGGSDSGDGDGGGDSGDDGPAGDDEPGVDDGPGADGGGSGGGDDGGSGEGGSGGLDDDTEHSCACRSSGRFDPLAALSLCLLLGLRRGRRKGVTRASSARSTGL